jgi:peroxiredoxin
VKVLAVSADPPEDSVKMKQELDLGFPLLSDPDERVVKQYGLVHEKGYGGKTDIARPADLLLDDQGVIRWARFTDNIRVRPHPEEILAEAKRLR